MRFRVWFKKGSYTVVTGKSWEVAKRKLSSADIQDIDRVVTFR